MAAQTQIKVTSDVSSFKKGLEESKKSMGSLRKEFNDARKSAMNLTNEYRKMSKEMQNSDYGKRVKAQLDSAIKQAGELKDVMGDVNEEIKNLASDTQFADGMKLMATNIGNVSSAVVALTGDSEKMKEVLLDIARIQTMTNSVKSLTEAFQKQNLVLLKNPYVLAAAAIAALGVALYEASKDSDKFTESIKAADASTSDFANNSLPTLIKQLKNKAQVEQLTQQFNDLQDEIEETEENIDAILNPQQFDWFNLKQAWKYWAGTQDIDKTREHLWQLRKEQQLVFTELNELTSKPDTKPATKKIKKTTKEIKNEEEAVKKLTESLKELEDLTNNIFKNDDFTGWESLSKIFSDAINKVNDELKKTAKSLADIYRQMSEFSRTQMKIDMYNNTGRGGIQAQAPVGIEPIVEEVDDDKLDFTAVLNRDWVALNDLNNLLKTFQENLAKSKTPEEYAKWSDLISETNNKIKTQTKQSNALENSITSAAAAANTASAAFNSLGTALHMPALNIIGTIAQSIANIALAYSDAFVKDNASKSNIFSFIASVAAGVASMIATIASVKKATAFANGGIVKGTTTIGDYNIARVNDGEMILNQRQQKSLFNMLNNGIERPSFTFDGGNVEFEISGSRLVGVLSNYNKKISKR